MNTNGSLPQKRIMALSAECPECNADVTFEEMPKVKQITFCQDCNTKLEVAFLYPIMLDWADDDLYDVDDLDDD